MTTCAKLLQRIEVQIVLKVQLLPEQQSLWERLLKYRLIPFKKVAKLLVIGVPFATNS